MDIDKWEQIKENIQKVFRIVEEKQEDLIVRTQDGELVGGKAEIIIIQTPDGQIKLVLESRPQVLDKKFIYSHRAGQTARTEYEFSETELTHKLRAFRWDDAQDDWKEIDAGNFA